MSDYGEADYRWIKELLQYPNTLEERLEFFDDTSQIKIPDDPIERVIFQDRAKEAIRKIAQNKGHMLMVGRPGTGKSLLANMFNEVLDESLGDYIRPKKAIVAYPGKDINHVRIAYEDPSTIDKKISQINQDIKNAKNTIGEFSLEEQIESAKKMKKGLFYTTLGSGVGGLFFPPAFFVMGLAGMGSIFMHMQENNHKVTEKTQREQGGNKTRKVKYITDMVPEVLYDPRNDKNLMARISEPNAKSMKGGFRHDPYQSGGLGTPAHKRAYLGAHAKSPILCIDELKTLIKNNYMPDLLEIMQNKKYILEGGKETGSGAADRSENELKADNIILASCNHDTLKYLQSEGDGAFLSRIEDKGEVIEMESSVPETLENIRAVAQYVKQEIINIGKEFKEVWGSVIEKEGYEGVKGRSEKIFGKRLPDGYKLKEREFLRTAVLEIIKELRCRSGDRKLSSMLRPVNGIIKTAELEAILENSSHVDACHVRIALEKHLSFEGSMGKEMAKHKKDLKKYISKMTDSVGYVVGLSVINSRSSGQMYGQPLPIRCQINAGGGDSVHASGKLGDIAKGAAENVRASIKKVFNKIYASQVSYEMHIEYIQAHGGVEGDSASVAMDVGLMSDYIQQPVNQKYGVTGSLTGDLVLAVGGVTEKVKSIMDIELGMDGACVPWLNKHDVEPLLINRDAEYIQNGDIPGIRIYRTEGREDSFDIYFCKTKYNAYKILMGIDKGELEKKMFDRSKKDLEFMKKLKKE